MVCRRVKHSLGNPGRFSCEMREYLCEQEITHVSIEHEKGLSAEILIGYVRPVNTAPQLNCIEHK